MQHPQPAPFAGRAPSPPHSFSSPPPTSWYFSRAMLVSAPSCVSMKMSLLRWMFSRIPWGVGGRRKGHQRSMKGRLAHSDQSWWGGRAPTHLSPAPHTHLLVPGRHNVLHVLVAGEKGHDAIRNDGRHLQEQVAIVPDDGCGTAQPCRECSLAPPPPPELSRPACRQAAKGATDYQQVMPACCAAGPSLSPPLPGPAQSDCSPPSPGARSSSRPRVLPPPRIFLHSCGRPYQCPRGSQTWS